MSGGAALLSLGFQGLRDKVLEFRDLGVKASGYRGLGFGGQSLQEPRCKDLHRKQSWHARPLLN